MGTYKIVFKVTEKLFGKTLFMSDDIVNAPSYYEATKLVEGLVLANNPDTMVFIQGGWEVKPEILAPDEQDDADISDDEPDESDFDDMGDVFTITQGEWDDIRREHDDSINNIMQEKVSENQRHLIHQTAVHHGINMELLQSLSKEQLIDMLITHELTLNTIASDLEIEMGCE